LDGTGFRDLFEDLICGVTVFQLIEIGSLSRYKYYAPERSMSLVGVKKRGGDYRQNQIEEANPAETVAADCLKAYGDYLQDKRAVIFAVSVAHSISIACSFQSCGISAAHLDGNSDPDTRSQTMQKFREGSIKVLTNCALFDEGLDIPELDGVILARPTASLGRYLQMVGRALRPSPNKDHAMIIDLAGNWDRHGLPDDDRLWSLDGVKSVQRSPSKRLQRRNDGEIEEVTIEITPSVTQFQEISQSLPPIADAWDRVLDLLIHQQMASNYQRGWVGFKLAEIKPPLEVWKLAGRKLGYHPKWAEHRWQECQAAVG
jgi:superfamily II DNA or RNA helicase